MDTTSSFDALIAYGWSDRVAALYHAHPARHGAGPGRVTRVERSVCTVVDGAGAERLLAVTAPVAVGDWVVVVADRLDAVLPRWSALERQNPDGSGTQVLAADVDLVLVTVPADRPHAARAERAVALGALDAVGHDPTAVFFGEDYYNHHDHRALGFAVLDASSPAAALPHYFPAAGPPHQVQQVLLSGTLEPSVWVDIEEVIAAKVAAVACHASQFADGGSWATQAVRRRAEEEGRRAGVALAEGFRRLRLGG